MQSAFYMRSAAIFVQWANSYPKSLMVPVSEEKLTPTLYSLRLSAA